MRAEAVGRGRLIRIAERYVELVGVGDNEDANKEERTDGKIEMLRNCLNAPDTRTSAASERHIIGLEAIGVIVVGTLLGFFHS